jgi:hypothetical protein
MLSNLLVVVKWGASGFYWLILKLASEGVIVQLIFNDCGGVVVWCKVWVCVGGRHLIENFEVCCANDHTFPQ